MTEAERAIQWCHENGPTVRFFSVYGHPRVEVRLGGWGPVERNTLTECIQFIEKKREASE